VKLNRQELQNRGQWTSKGYHLPKYDIAAVKAKTMAEPVWLHFGAGNIFRGFPAVLQQKLLNDGLSDRGIIVAEAFDEEIIDKAYTPFDNLSLINPGAIVRGSAITGFIAGRGCLLTLTPMINSSHLPRTGSFGTSPWVESWDRWFSSSLLCPFDLSCQRCSALLRRWF